MSQQISVLRLVKTPAPAAAGRMSSTTDDLKHLAWENKGIKKALDAFQKLQGSRELLLNPLVIYFEEGG